MVTKDHGMTDEISFGNTKQADTNRGFKHFTQHLTALKRFYQTGNLVLKDRT